MLFRSVVDCLEQRYPQHDGLNLSFETREGVLKHCSRRKAQQLEAQEPGGVGARFLDRTRPSLEAQLCNLADEIAYNAHDIDDGVRSGLLALDQLDAVPLVARLRREVASEFPSLDAKRTLSQQVYDVIAATGAALGRHRPADADAARCLPALVCFSGAMADESAALKAFLRVNLYRHPQVVETTDRAQQVIRDLFEAYAADPQQMPPEHAARDQDRRGLRAVADYIAGMTDRYALREHERITGRRLFG